MDATVYIYNFLLLDPLPLVERERLFSQRLAGAHLGQPCWSVHASGRVSPGSSSSRSRPSDMDSGKPAFMSPKALTLPRGARFISLAADVLFFCLIRIVSKIY